MHSDQNLHMVCFGLPRMQNFFMLTMDRSGFTDAHADLISSLGAHVRYYVELVG